MDMQQEWVQHTKVMSSGVATSNSSVINSFSKKS